MRNDFIPQPNTNPTTRPTTGSHPISLPYEGRAGEGSFPHPYERGNGREPSAKRRVYGRSELAQLYYGRPVSDSAARRWFRRELSYVPGLMETLQSLGYSPKGKIFSRAQVAAIFDALGEP